MEIILQINNSEKKRLDKNITDLVTISGTLRESTSVVDPKIVIEGDLSSFVNCNYMTISAFNRSYFINKITSVNNNLFDISAHVDVLSTYKTQIRQNTAIIARQEKKWNLYLNDGVFKTYQNPYIVTKAFPSGFTEQHFIFSVAGG